MQSVMGTKKGKENIAGGIHQGVGGAAKTRKQTSHNVSKKREAMRRGTQGGDKKQMG